MPSRPDSPGVVVEVDQRSSAWSSVEERKEQTLEEQAGSDSAGDLA